MSGYEFTPQAAGDLFEIWSYVARDSVEAANRVEEAIYAACSFLAEGPLPTSLLIYLSKRAPDSG